MPLASGLVSTLSQIIVALQVSTISLLLYAVILFQMLFAGTHTSKFFGKCLSASALYISTYS
jgi:hypothetical protein